MQKPRRSYGMTIDINGKEVRDESGWLVMRYFVPTGQMADGRLVWQVCNPETREVIDDTQHILLTRHGLHAFYEF